MLTLIHLLASLIGQALAQTNGDLFLFDLTFNVFVRDYQDGYFFIQHNYIDNCFQVQEFESSLSELSQMSFYQIDITSDLIFGFLKDKFYIVDVRIVEGQYGPGYCPKAKVLAILPSDKMPFNPNLHYLNIYRTYIHTAWPQLNQSNIVPGKITFLELYQMELKSSKPSATRFTLLDKLEIISKDDKTLCNLRSWKRLYSHRYLSVVMNTTFTYFLRDREDHSTGQPITAYEMVLVHVCPLTKIHLTELRFPLAYAQYEPLLAFVGNFDNPTKFETYLIMATYWRNGTTEFQVYDTEDFIRRLINLRAYCHTGRLSKRLQMMTERHLFHSITPTYRKGEDGCIKSKDSYLGLGICSLNLENNLLSGAAPYWLKSYTIQEEIISMVACDVTRPWQTIMLILVTSKYVVKMCILPFLFRHPMANNHLECVDYSIPDGSAVITPPVLDIFWNLIFFWNKNPKDTTMRTLAIIDCNTIPECVWCETGGLQYYCNWQSGACVFGNRSKPIFNACYTIKSFRPTKVASKSKVKVTIILDGISYDQSSEAIVTIGDSRCKIIEMKNVTITCYLTDPKPGYYYILIESSLEYHYFTKLWARSKKKLHILVNNRNANWPFYTPIFLAILIGTGLLLFLAVIVNSSSKSKKRPALSTVGSDVDFIRKSPKEEMRARKGKLGGKKLPTLASVLSAKGRLSSLIIVSSKSKA